MANTLTADEQSQIERLYSTAQSLCAQGDWGGGQALYENALSLQKLILGSDHPDLIMGHHKLGMVYRVNNKTVKAAESYEEALKLAKIHWGEDDLRYATRLNYLAGLYNAQKEYTYAENIIKQSLAIYEKNLDPEHPVVGLTMLALAIVAQRQGMPDDATQLFQRYKLINLQDVSAGDELTRGLCKLAEVFYLEKKYDEADLLFRHALIISEHEIWPDHPFVAESLVVLSGWYASQGRIQQAEQFLTRAIAILEKSLGVKHPKLESTLKAYARLLRSLQRNEEAREIEQRADNLTLSHRQFAS